MARRRGNNVSRTPRPTSRPSLARLVAKAAMVCARVIRGHCADGCVHDLSTLLHDAWPRFIVRAEEQLRCAILWCKIDERHDDAQAAAPIVGMPRLILGARHRIQYLHLAPIDTLHSNLLVLLEEGLYQRP